MVKKDCPVLSLYDSSKGCDSFVFDARSVHEVREHGKKATCLREGRERRLACPILKGGPFAFNIT